MVLPKLAICLAVAAMAKPAGRAGTPPSHLGAARGGRPPASRRQVERLGEDMYRWGILVGSRHARAGLDYSQDMAKYPWLIGVYAFAGLGFNPLDNPLAKRMFFAPPHLQPIYDKAFLAGYGLGHELNLPKERRIALLSLDHLLRIGSALQSYALEIERKPRIPRMTSIASLRRLLVPLMGVRVTDFVNPYTNQPYGLNASLSGKDYADLKAHTPHTVFAYEATPAPDGTRGVLFVSGEAVRVPEREWARLRKASGIA